MYDRAITDLVIITVYPYEGESYTVTVPIEHSLTIELEEAVENWVDDNLNNVSNWDYQFA
jgi:hypothetical protein